MLVEKLTNSMNDKARQRTVLFFRQIVGCNLRRNKIKRNPFIMAASHKGIFGGTTYLLF